MTTLPGSTLPTTTLAGSTVVAFTRAAPTPLNVDVDQAWRFLAMLDPEAGDFTFQTFDDRDVPEIEKKNGLAKVITTADLKPLLDKHNDGAGVYVTVNLTDGRGRKTENIKHVRAVWQEDDNGRGGPFPIEPSIVVESSPGRFHRYWLVADEWPVDEQGHADFDAVLNRMVKSYGSDNGAKGVARVLRVPGFLHRKDPAQPHMVRIAGGNGHRYTRRQIMEAFPPVEPPVRKPSSERSSAGPHGSADDYELARKMLDFIPADDRAEWINVGMILKHKFDHAGFQLWNQWSAKSGKYDGEDMPGRWGGFEPNGSISFGSLQHMAEKFGWTNGISRAVETETAEAKSTDEKTAKEPLVYVDISKWIGAPVPKREWAVLNRIPARNVTVLSGTGGIGKTIVAMILAAVGVLAKDWFGAMPEFGPVIFLSGEEPEDEMHRRFADIVDHLNSIHQGVTYQHLIKGGLHLIDKAGKDAMLAVPDRNGRMQTTPLFKQLLAEAKRIKPKLVILDNRNKVYGGNINDPTQVSEFITALHGFAIDANTAVLLILHPSVAGIAAASDSSHKGLAGAMNWHDLPRGRLYFEKVKTDDDKEIDKDLRVMTCQKNNYGPDDETVTLRWKTGTNGSGVFVMEAAPGSIEKMAADNKVDEFFLTSLRRLNDANRGPFSHKKQSNNYAPTAFAALPEAKAVGIKKSDLVRSMERLLDSKKIAVEPYGPPSRKLTQLVITGGQNG
jgi:RecA-family ATPase